MKILHWSILMVMLSMLLACTGNQAPVIDGWKQNATAAGDYRVQPGDSLYSVAWGFGVDYHDLARYNLLSEPYAIHPGQILHMSPPATLPIQEPEAVKKTAPIAVTPAIVASSATTTIPKQKSAPASVARTQPKSKAAIPPPAPATKPPTLVEQKAAPTITSPTNKAAAGKWLWPTKGRVVRGYSAAAGGNHGLDISGKLNQPVLASSSGKVVYAGSGMPGYGNLIIIKHNENELSAYAFNKSLAVKEGDNVKAGQCIAYMGKNDAGQTLLHFEIRRDGKPVDPMNYLR